MYGWVSGLPVDTLRSMITLGMTKFAIHAAQSYISKEQHNLSSKVVLSKLYNSKIKGSDIEVGDHVLVANKRARTKQNVADCWASTIYTIVDKNSQTHI